jgi:plasmid stabilization system protein ParE
MREVARAERVILAGPDRWPLISKRARRFVLRKYPYVLIYRIADRGVEIVAVAHRRRRPGYWSRR